MKKTKSMVIEQMIQTAEDAVSHFKDLVESKELEPYIKGDQLRGQMIDDDETISAESVAILGGYSVAQQIRDNLKLIAAGRETENRKEAKTEVSVEVVAFENGKQVKINKVPKEVIDTMRKIIEENGNGKEE